MESMMTKSRYFKYNSSVKERDVICKLITTLKAFNVIGQKSRMYVNWSGDAPFVDVIYEG